MIESGRMSLYDWVMHVQVHISEKKVHLTEKKRNISINIFTLNIRGNN